MAALRVLVSAPLRAACASSVRSRTTASAAAVARAGPWGWSAPRAHSAWPRASKAAGPSQAPPRRGLCHSPRSATGGGSGAGLPPPRAGGGGGGSGGGGASSGDGASSGGFLAAYMALLASNPVTTKAATAGLLNLLGDVICQLFFEDGPFDARRAAIFTALGGVLIGPALHVWYNTLGRLVGGSGAGVAVKKLLIDQFLFAPPFLAAILSLLTAAEAGPSAVLPKLKQDWSKVVVTNWYLWVPFQFINFRFVPPQLTVAAANCCAVVWNVILSLISHAKLAHAVEAAPVAAPAKGNAPAGKAKK